MTVPLNLAGKATHNVPFLGFIARLLQQTDLCSCQHAAVAGLCGVWQLGIIPMFLCLQFEPF